MRIFNDFLLKCLKERKIPVLVIDEAQNLSRKVLEEIRLLSNLETQKSKLLQMILVGQPELREKLGRSELRQLNQRVVIRYHLPPLNLLEVKDYVRKRLLVAGTADVNLFSNRALETIARYSGGIPRLINVIGDNALLIGYALGVRGIDEGIIREVVTDLALKRENTPAVVANGVFMKRYLSRWQGMLWIVVLLAILVLLMVFFHQELDRGMAFIRSLL